MSIGEAFVIKCFALVYVVTKPYLETEKIKYIVLSDRVMLQAILLKIKRIFSEIHKKKEICSLKQNFG